MAYTAGNLHLRAGAPGDLSYTYDAGATDTMATVMADGFFNNADDDLNLTVDDLIFIQASDGNFWARVGSIAANAVTLHFAGGALPPVRTYASGSAAARTNLSVGFYEVGTAIADATRAVLPTPYVGAEVMVRKVASGSGPIEFDAGASASDVSVGLGGGTGVTYDGTGNRRVTLRTEGDMFHVVGTSTTRWQFRNVAFTSSVISVGGSVVIAGT